MPTMLAAARMALLVRRDALPQVGRITDQGRKLYASKRASESRKAERRGVQMERPSSISPEAPDVPAKDVPGEGNR